MSEKHRIDITEDEVRRLAKDPPSKDEGARTCYDSTERGFGVRITYRGTVTFFLSYVNKAGMEHRFSLGRYSAAMTVKKARLKAEAQREQIDAGADPQAEKKAAKLAKKEQAAVEAANQRTVNELAGDYLEKHARRYKSPPSVRNDRQMLKSVILPRLGGRAVSGVDKETIEQIHQELKATPYHANRVLALLSKMFALAVEWGWRADNPAKKIAHHKEKQRKEWLSAEQIAKLQRALDDYPDQDAVDALRLRAVTGAREREVLRAEWKEFDLERGTWTKPSHHTKTKVDVHVPLNADALALLKRMHQHKTGPYLFPAPEPFVEKPGGHKSHESPTRTTLRNPWLQVSKAAGLTTVVEVKKQADNKKMTWKRARVVERHRPLYKMNILRHTFASHLVSQGESLQVVGGLLGHTRAQTTMRYSHINDEALRAAANRFGSVWRGNTATTSKTRRPGAQTPRRRSTTAAR